jgi:hypothetical protein
MATKARRGHKGDCGRNRQKDGDDKVQRGGALKRVDHGFHGYTRMGKDRDFLTANLRVIFTKRAFYTGHFLAWRATEF